MKTQKRRGSTVDLLVVLMFLSVIIGLLLTATSALSDYHVSQESMKQNMRHGFLYGSLYITMFITTFCFGSAAEESSRFLGLQYGRWHRKKVFFGLMRKGVRDRLAYLIGSISISAATLWLVGFEVNGLETHWFYPIALSFMSILLISIHVNKRSKPKWKKFIKRYNDEDWYLFFHTKQVLKRLQREARWHKQEIAQSIKLLKKEGYTVVEPSS